jgi:hypothetical protein
MKHIPAWKPAATALAALGLAVLLAACGAPVGASAPPTATPDPEKAMLQFAQCMRAHGINMPDPTSNGNGGFSVRISGKGSEGGMAQMQAAQKACQKYQPKLSGGTSDNPAQFAQMQDRMLAFARCMRRHGINMPDPKFTNNGGGPIGVTLGKPGSNSFDPRSSQFQSAQKACSSYLGKAGGPGGIVTFGR